MTDEAKKIVYALRCCAQDQNCFGCGSKCHYIDAGLYCNEKLKADAADMIERLAEELEQVRKERDAAVTDLKLIDDLFREDPEMCCFCKHAHADPDEAPCKSCNPYPIENKWEWRGVCAENSGGDAE